ncbi:hypothetical protein RUND412_006297 [Rhizina undulata]
MAEGTETQQVDIDGTNVLYDEDYDCADMSSLASGCVSITSSVMDYPFENGRRYHRYSQGHYLLPNDEVRVITCEHRGIYWDHSVNNNYFQQTEQDRLDMHHHIFLKMLDGKLTLAPIGDDPKRILDVGTGTGIWALDAADEYPNAKVIGTDLSPIQPNVVLPNCRFEVDDAELDWTYPEDHFNFIHSRNIAQSIRDWPRYVQQMYKHLKPGGYIEIIEHGLHVVSPDGTFPPSCALYQWFEKLRAALAKLGMPDMGHIVKEYLLEAGFIDIQETIIQMPWGHWPRERKWKEVGYWALLNTETSFEAYGLALFTRVLGMTAEEAVDLCHRAHLEVKNGVVRVYNPNYFVVARKPLN